MSCRRYRPWLSEFTTDGIDPRRAAEFTRHLAECASCAAEWAELAAVDEALTSFTVPDPGDSFFHQLTGQIMAQVEQVPARGTWGWLHGLRRLAALGATGCVVAALGLAISVGRPTPQHVPDTAEKLAVEIAATPRVAPPVPVKPASPTVVVAAAPRPAPEPVVRAAVPERVMERRLAELRRPLVASLAPEAPAPRRPRPEPVVAPPAEPAAKIVERQSAPPADVDTSANAPVVLGGTSRMFVVRADDSVDRAADKPAAAAPTADSGDGGLHVSAALAAVVEQ